MAYSKSDNPSHGRKLLPLVLGGCAVLALCVVPICLLGAITANAGYWINRQPNFGVSEESSALISAAEVKSLPAGNADDGEQVFTSSGCSACHSLDAGVRSIGPSLSGISTSAATRKPGYTAEMYLYESIISPNAYVVDGFQSSIMPQKFSEILTQQELANLVAFLMTIH